MCICYNNRRKLITMLNGGIRNGKKLACKHTADNRNLRYIRIYWFIVLTDEVNQHSGEDDTSGGIAFLLTLVTCGIYGIYWAYRMGIKTGIMKEKRGSGSSDDRIVYLILELFGLGIIVYALAQNEINNTLIYKEAMRDMGRM